MTPNDAARLLHAYVDGELDLATSIELEAQLAQDPALRAACQRLRELSAGIRAGASYQRAPSGLSARVAAAAGLPTAAPPPGMRGYRARIAVACACAGLLLAAGTAVWFDSASANRLAEDLLSAHARATLGGHLVEVASSDRHAVKPWLSARLDFSPTVKDLSGHGFELLGGRLDYVERQPAAVLVYRRRQHIIEVFVWAASPPRGEGTDSLRGFNLIGFARDGIRYSIVSDLNRGELADFARLLQDRGGSSAGG